MPKMTITRTCRNCGKSFEMLAARLKKEANPGQWCSMKCRTRDGGWHPKGRKIDLPESSMVQEYLTGDSQSVIASRYGVSVSLVSVILRKHSVVMRVQKISPVAREKATQLGRERFLTNNPLTRNDVPSNEVCQSYLEGESALKIAARFKCDVSVIYNRVRKAGIEVRRQGYTNCIACSDGHIADSEWEHQIDEWLAARGIAHEIHPRTPWYTSDRRSYGDFLVGTIYIEVWGIMGSMRYETRRLAKTALYQEHDARLIQIFPHHILDQDFSPLFELLPPT